MRRPLYSAVFVVLCLGSCSPPSPKRAIAYNFELIGIYAPEDGKMSAAESARMNIALQAGRGCWSCAYLAGMWTTATSSSSATLPGSFW